MAVTRHRCLMGPFFDPILNGLRRGGLSLNVIERLKIQTSEATFFFEQGG